MLIRWLGFVISLLIIAETIALPARAESPLLGTTLLERAQNLAELVRTKARPDNGSLSAYAQSWQAKCANIDADQSCFLVPRTTVFHDGQVLLFRGESGKFLLPGTSEMLRDMLTGNSSFCDSNCSLAEASKNISSAISSLLKQPIGLSRSGKVAFDEILQKWFVNDYQQGVVCKIPDPTARVPADDLAKCSPAVDAQGRDLPGSFRLLGTLQFLLQAHQTSSDSYSLISNGGLVKRFDPLVSFSSSPLKASEFAGANGRVIVISVPKTLVDGSENINCRAVELQSNEVIPIAACGDPSADDADYSAEAESDFMLLTDPASVIDVLDK